jgi:hypothetical protein
MDVELEEAGLSAFAEVDVVSDFETGVLQVLQANGIAGIASNTLMMGWTERVERRAAMLRVVRQAALLDKSSLICRIAPRGWSTRLQRIDVWWGGLQNNGDMLLLFAHLMAANREWSSARITVKSVTSNAMTFEETERSMRELLSRSRIQAESKVIRLAEGQTVHDIIHAESSDADLVFLGLRAPKEGQETDYAERLAILVGDLPTVILVKAAGPFAGLLI